MSLTKPYRRTCRPRLDGRYGGEYLRHPHFAQEPRHFVRAFLSLQADLMVLMDYIEPADANLRAYSHKTQQLLVRACVEVEANLTAILRENGYGSGKLTMNDYRLVEHSHRLSGYRIRIPMWRGTASVRQPFARWAEVGQHLTWYRAYNKSKHDRHEHFQLATFEALIDAVAGLLVVLSAQFWTEDYSSTEQSLTVESGYDTDDGMDSGIGGFFRVQFPVDWSSDERYSFNWQTLRDEPDPFITFDYGAVKA